MSWRYRKCDDCGYCSGGVWYATIEGMTGTDQPDPDPDPPKFLDRNVTAGGVPADQLTVWHTEHTINLDFSVDHSDDPPRQVVVTRLRIPPSAVLGILDVLRTGILDYELDHGDIPTKKDDTP